MKYDEVAETRGTIFNAVLKERQRQDKKWGEQNHDDLKWHAIFQEEVGEIAKAVTKSHVPPVENQQENLDNLKEELIQTIAVGFSWLECIERNKKK